MKKLLEYLLKNAKLQDLSQYGNQNKKSIEEFKHYSKDYTGDHFPIRLFQKNFGGEIESVKYTIFRDLETMTFDTNIDRIINNNNRIL